MEIYLEPRDVAAPDAQKVLDFLNAARTADEIASTIEFLGELDIGPRVAARLLARREELGKFTTLQQVADVPQVGPERFTEIVVAIARVNLGRLVSASAVADLERQVRDLQEGLDALRNAAARPLVTLRALADAPFLGESVQLVVDVSRADGEPWVDAPVDLVATWGTLRASDGYTVGEGAALTVHTDIFGRATTTLSPPTSEDLQDPQQAALETSLAALDRGATTPRDLTDGLRELASQYRWEAASDLRRAIDVYFRDFRPRLLGTVNFRDYLERWSFLESTVTASAVAASSVEGAATLTIPFTDWLGAWLETYLAVLEEESDLVERLRSEATQTEDPGAVLDGVQRGVRAFVDRQRGLAGAYAGQIVAERSMLSFLDTEVPALPLATRLKLYPALTTQSRTVATMGVTAFGAIEQARVDVREEIRDRTGVFAPAAIGELVGEAFESRITAFEAAQDAKVDARIAPIESALSEKADTAELTNFRGEISGSLRQVRTRVTEIEGRFPG
jgi:hypothetical protein